jgi:cell wall-associated NlpC family hydrolase
MPSALVSLLLSGFGRDALKMATGVGLVVLLVAAFVLSTFLAVVQAVAGAVLPAPHPAAAGPFGAPGGAGPGDPGDRNRLVTDALPQLAGDGAPVPPSGPVAAAVLARARSQLGSPYVWGGASPQTSFDCSGLVQWAYRLEGVILPRTAQQQFEATVPLSREQLTPGDLLFFAGTYLDPHDWITHVGIYLGNGLMIDAESADVRVSPVFSGYWAAHYAGAGRVSAGSGAARSDRR